jgi:hypothetical protein
MGDLVLIGTLAVNDKVLQRGIEAITAVSQLTQRVRSDTDSRCKGNRKPIIYNVL